MSDNFRGRAVFLLVFLSLIWGTSFILMKKGLIAFGANEVGALRVVAAALFLLPPALMRLKGLKREHYWKLLASGLMGIFIPAFLFAKAQSHMDSSVAGVLNTLTPIFVIIIGSLIFGQRFKLLTVVGILLGLSGALILSMSRSGGSITGFNAYSLLIVLSCLLYGSNLNFIKYKITDLSALTITSVSVLLIGPLAAVYLFGFTDFTHKLNVVPGAWTSFWFIVLLGLMSTAVATVVFNKLVKISTPLFASSVTYLMPVVAVAWGVLDNEKLQAGHFVGMAAIMGGVYLANRKR